MRRSITLSDGKRCTTIIIRCTTLSTYHIIMLLFCCTGLMSLYEPSGIKKIRQRSPGLRQPNNNNHTPPPAKETTFDSHPIDCLAHHTGRQWSTGMSGTWLGTTATCLFALQIAAGVLVSQRFKWFHYYLLTFFWSSHHRTTKAVFCFVLLAAWTLSNCGKKRVSG